MSIFKKNKDASPLGRNAFDLSQKRLFTASAGELLPCYAAECLPGDKFKIKVSDFLRTQTCNTAAFSRIRQYVHFFFVPYRLLSTQWSQYIMRSPRMDSTAFNSFGDSSNTFGQFRRMITFPYYRVLTTMVGELNHIQYNGQNPWITEGMDIETILKSNVTRNALVASRTLKLLDLLEYGSGSVNYSNLFAVDADQYAFGYQGIYNALSIPNTTEVRPTFVQNSAAAQTRVNLFRLLAYNRIYQDFYRDPRLETFNSVYSNIDDRSKYIASNTDVSADSLEKYDTNIITHFKEGDFAVRYRNYPKDYFTSADVNPYKQDSLMTRLPFFNNGGSVISYQTNPLSAPASQVTTQLNGVVGTSTPVIVPGTAGYGSPSLPVNSAFAYRAFYALERWASRQAHASSQSYADLVKAHFGINVPDSCDSARFLGGDSAAVVINENVSTASTDTASLGSLSGVGKSVFDNECINFEAKEHGVIMGIFSVMPEPDYNAYGVDRENLHQLPEDFFQPEYDGLGYQAVNTIELSNTGVSQLRTDIQSQTTELNTVFGYMPIYSEYRTKVDKVFGEFRSALPLSYWVNPRRVGDYNTLITSSFSKCLPTDLDSIFQVNWITKVLVPKFDFKIDYPANGSTAAATRTQSVPQHYGLQVNDQFFVNLEVDCKAIRHMSSDGVQF